MRAVGILPGEVINERPVATSAINRLLQRDAYPIVIDPNIVRQSAAASDSV
jgi:hypothetical protein